MNIPAPYSGLVKYSSFVLMVLPAPVVIVSINSSLFVATKVQSNIRHIHITLLLCIYVKRHLRSQPDAVMSMDTVTYIWCIFLVTAPHVLNVVTLSVTPLKGMVRSLHQYTIVVRVTAHWGKCQVNLPDNWGGPNFLIGYVFPLSPSPSVCIKCQPSCLEVNNLLSTGV